MNFSGFMNTKPQINVGSVPLVGGFSSKKGSPKVPNAFSGVINDQSQSSGGGSNSSDEDDEDEKPMGIEEFKARVMALK